MLVSGVSGTWAMGNGFPFFLIPRPVGRFGPADLQFVWTLKEGVQTLSSGLLQHQTCGVWPVSDSKPCD